MAGETDEFQNNEYRRLGVDLGRRTSAPLKEPTFVIYVVLAILLFGGLGIWVEVFKIVTAEHECPPELAGLITAVITYFPTLMGAAAIQLVFASVNKGDKAMIAFAILLMFVLLISALLLAYGSARHPTGVLIFGSILSAVAIWTWWITNGDDPTFKRVPDPEVASGGSTQRGLPGDLEGFEV